MTIFQFTWRDILGGSKTQTSRLVKAGDTLLLFQPNREPFVEDIAGRTRWEVGKDYAIQPGRGKKAIYWRYSDMTGTGYEVLNIPFSVELLNWGWKQLRYRILDINIRDRRRITEEDAKKEGFLHPLDFLKLWIQMHDKRAWQRWVATFKLWEDSECIPEYSEQYREMRRIVDARPADRYIAWVLDFEVVR